MNVKFVSHGQPIVDAHELHILLEQYDFIYLLEVMNFFNVVVVGGVVLDLWLLIVQGQVSGGFEGFNLMLNKETSQVLELNGWTVRLISSIKQVDQVLHKFLSFWQTAIFKHLLHYFDKLITVNSHVRISLKRFWNRK